ncbi:hypothetical protein B0H10DRAFT_695666 [Mycena sp. CBHHK59/15]|nr:hypothetical protein B0H10DRAFT_695666 [Mycena sp. CBHHK59/15]
MVRELCPDGNGKLMGTSLICALLEIGMSIAPSRMLKRVFPPMVTGLVIFVSERLSLGGSFGILNWGIYQLCPTISAPQPLPWGSPEFIGVGFLCRAEEENRDLLLKTFKKGNLLTDGLGLQALGLCQHALLRTQRACACRPLDTAPGAQHWREVIAHDLGT